MIKRSQTGRSWLKAIVTRVYEADCFAGNLFRLLKGYENASKTEKQDIDSQLEKIMCHLLMPNGTLKATMTGRNTEMMKKAIASIHLKDDLNVLEIGGSLGIDSLSTYEVLTQRSRIQSYIIGDRYNKIFFDEKRRVVFDGDGNLLQVKVGNMIFNVFSRRDTEKHPFIRATGLIASWFRSRYSFIRSQVKEIFLYHPMIHANICSGRMQVIELDVLQPWLNKYDMIISFNLIDDEYFSNDELMKIMKNLQQGLEDEGNLIIGVSNHFNVYVNSKGELNPVKVNSSSWGHKINMILNMVKQTQ